MVTKKKTMQVAPKRGSKELYILDTNILVHDPKSLFAFERKNIGIPVMVLEELDKFKHEGTDRGRNCRQTIRLLDDLRSKGSLKEGVKLDNGSLVQVLFTPNQSLLLNKAENQDNAILMLAIAYQEMGYDVHFVTKDLNARVKADSLGVLTEDYTHASVTQEDFYHGWIRREVPAVELKSETPRILQDLADELAYNEFVILESANNAFNNRVFRYLGGKKFKSVYPPKLQWPLQPRNPQQLMAMDLLMDREVQFLCLFGPAGTGKTFLALLAGLHQVLVDEEYEKMLISRPVIPLGRDIGYLPGTMEEKLYSWMLPIYDNVQFIQHAAKVESHIQIIEKDSEKRRNKGKHRHQKHNDHREERGKSSFMSLDDLIKRHKISLEAITYMRGRSIPFQFILIDEAQNLTPHEIKTLVTRAGEGSKIVLAGDPYQIDSPYLDFASNGLVAASERFKGQKVFGSVYLETSERSLLSQLAGELL